MSRADGGDGMQLWEEFRRAELFARSGDPAEAARVLEAVAEAAPEHTDARLRLGLAYFASAQLHRARDTFAGLVERDPSDHYARHLLGRTLERLSRPEEALPQLRLAAAMSDDPEYAAAVVRAQARLAG
jgi:tetratricopeptide (TPR) repeat protein